MTESQIRTVVLTLGVSVALAGAWLYLDSMAAAGRISRSGAVCSGGAALVKRPSGVDGPVPREAFDGVTPLFVNQGNLCVFAKILAKSSREPAPTGELEDLRMMIFFSSNRKEVFITGSGAVVSLATEERYLVKKEVVEVMTAEIERISQAPGAEGDAGAGEGAP